MYDFKNLKSIELTDSSQRKIIDFLSDLSIGSYALMKKSEKTQVLKLTESEGTDFFKPFCIADISFEYIKESNIFEEYHVPLNACPIDSDTQEFANALVFSV